MASNLQSLIQEWDGEAVVTRFDRATGTWMFVAMHSSVLGMPIGGCRMRVYPTPADGLRDAMRLAKGMTYKLAAIGFHYGGGKSVLAIPRPIEGKEREGLFRRFGKFLESLKGAYATGIDLGTTPGDMAVIAEETEWVFTGHRSRPDVVDPGPYTARGVLACMQAAAKHALGSSSLHGRAVLVQGVGDVGAPLTRMLKEAGAHILLSDLDEFRVSALAPELGAEAVSSDTIPDARCDILAPCAVGGTLNHETIPRLRCGIITGSANNQLEEEGDADRIHSRNILYCPDYIVNSGGAIAYAMMHEGVEDDAVINARIGQIGGSLSGILAEAGHRHESPLHAATRKVEEVLARARG